MAILKLGSDPEAALREPITLDPATAFRRAWTTNMVVLNIGSVMHHPQNERARASFMMWHHVQRLAALQAGQRRHPVGSSERKEWDERYENYLTGAFEAAGGFVALAETQPEHLESTQRPSQGSYAGHLLLRVLERAEQCPRDASVNKARDYLERALAARSKLVGSRSAIYALWHQFKPVAHLWAAAALAEVEAACFAAHEIPLGHFLAVAEELRRRSEEWHPGGRCTKTSMPVLDPQKTWRIDPVVALPAVRLSLSNLRPVK
jgi:hypothetical protein